MASASNELSIVRNPTTKASARNPLTTSTITRASEPFAGIKPRNRAAKGKTLTTGPRGGGRTLAKLRDHHVEAEHAYLRQLGGSIPTSASADAIRAGFLDALDARRRGDLPDTGPRGGKRWTVRQAIRRSAWHALDHAWEIEDRTSK